MNITDDVDYLEESILYNEHIGKLFDVTVENSNVSNNSRRNRDKLKISDSLKCKYFFNLCLIFKSKILTI